MASTAFRGGATAAWAQEKDLPGDSVIADRLLGEIQELRLDRKFDLAERKISEELQQLETQEFALRMLLHIEWIKSRTARAFEEKVESRVEACQAVVDGIDRLELQERENPNLILLQVQKAMVALDFGELVRKEIEVGSLASGEMRNRKMEESLGLLRSADRQFEELDGKLELMIPGRMRRTVNGELNQRELISLQNQVRYQRIRSRINRGLLYGSEDPDNRIAMVTSARDELQKVIPLIEKVDPSWWLSRLDLLACSRELSEYRQARQLLETYPVAEAPAAIQLALRAEEIRLAIAADDPEQAEQVIARGREIDGLVSPEFDFALLEYFIYLKGQAEAAERKNIQQTLDRMVVAIEKQHGAYWGRRANLLLIAATRSAGTAGTTELIRVAQESYRKKQYAESIGYFEKAAEVARKELDRKLELELRFQAIVIHRDLKQHQAVLEKCRTVTTQFGDTNRAATVHLVGILAAAELVRSGDLQPPDYVAMLDYHLQNWKHHPTVGQVAFFRGEYDLAQRDYAAAVMQFQASVRSMVRVDGAIDLDAFENSMNRLASSLIQWRLQNPAPELTRDFAARFQGEPFFEEVREKTSDLESTLHAWAVYALELSPERLTDVLAKLEAESVSSQNLLVCLVRVAIRLQQPDRLDRLKLRISELDKVGAEQLLQGFELDWPRSDSGQRVAITRTIGQLSPGESLESRYWKLLAEAYLQSGDRESAIQLLEKTVSRNVDLLEPQLSLARVLSESRDPAQIESGLVAWRRILSRSRERSPSWYEAKYRIAQCHLRLDRPEEARSMLEVLKAIPPGWSESSWNDRFDELYRRLKTGKEK